MRKLPLVLAVLAALLLAVSGLGVRLEWWSWRTGLGIFRWAAYAGLAVAALALAGLLVPRLRRGHLAAHGAALLLAMATAAVPIGMQQRARSVPPIHDITTDTVHPPAFDALVPLREKAGATNPPAYEGEAVARQQRAAYPDIQPVTLNEPPQTSFATARAIAEEMGWEIVRADPASGTLEATARTYWFGFRDDIVVRVTPASPGSRIDIRSKSRVGRSDVGANARRVREFLAKFRPS